jgi:hypothetical protein
MRSVFLSEPNWKNYNPPEYTYTVVVEEKKPDPPPHYIPPTPSVPYIPSVPRFNPPIPPTTTRYFPAVRFLRSKHYIPGVTITLLPPVAIGEEGGAEIAEQDGDEPLAGVPEDEETPVVPIRLQEARPATKEVVYYHPRTESLRRLWHTRLGGSFTEEILVSRR